MDLTAYPSRAQFQYATSVVPGTAAGIVAEANKAADGDLTTSAVLKPTALLSYTSLRVRFSSLAQVGKPAGVFLKTDNALNVALLGVAAINTYLASGTGTTLVKTYYTTSNTLSVGVGSSGLTQLTFTPTETFNQVEVQYYSVLAIGKDIAFYEAYITPSPLPVQLTTFQAKATPTGVTLRWETASELSSSHFVVERAPDAAADFRALGRVQSVGSSAQAQHYQFVDDTPEALGYYRLRQVDLDGSEAFSTVLAVRAERLAPALAAYPSPATEALTLTGAAGTRLTVADHLGRVVQSLVLDETQRQQLDVRSWPSGLYVVRDAATGSSLKVVKAASL